MKILVVRAAEDARRTASRLATFGHEAIVSPALEIRALDLDVPNEKFDALIATSAHALENAANISGLGAPLFVVGAHTADAARAAGIEPSVVASDAKALASILHERFRSRTRLLYLAGRDRKPDLEAALAAHDLRAVETYAAERADGLTDEAKRLLAAGEIDAVLHYSRRSAEIFLALAEEAGVTESARKTRHVAISADAAVALRAAGCKVEIAATPDEAAMLAMIGH